MLERQQPPAGRSGTRAMKGLGRERWKVCANIWNDQCLQAAFHSCATWNKVFCKPHVGMRCNQSIIPGRNESIEARTILTAFVFLCIWLWLCLSGSITGHLETDIQAESQLSDHTTNGWWGKLSNTKWDNSTKGSSPTRSTWGCLSNLSMWESVTSGHMQSCKLPGGKNWARSSLVMWRADVTAWPGLTGTYANDLNQGDQLPDSGDVVTGGGVWRVNCGSLCLALIWSTWWKATRI